MSISISDLLNLNYDPTTITTLQSNLTFNVSNYNVVPNTYSLRESETVIFNITTIDVADYTVLYWTNDGTTISQDFTDGLMNGPVVIVNNTAQIERTLSTDMLSEGGESIVFTLRGDSITGPVLAVATTVLVEDSSQTPYPPPPPYPDGEIPIETILGAFATIGYTGSQGTIGYTGSRGLQGYTGSQGILVEGEGIDILYNDDSSGTIVISAELATTANRGVASFSSASFNVSNGAVSIKNGGISNLQLSNSSVTIGNTTVSLGGTATTIGGLTELTIDNININGNTISSTDTNGNITISPNGTGYIDVDTSYIKNLKDPVDPQDAATKYYVDQMVSGLNWKSAVHLLAASNVALTGTTATLVIDGHPALDQADDGIYRILLTNQSTDSQNGIYVYTDNGSTYTLVRADDADVYTELIGSSVFVMEGDTYANTGWVQNNHYLTDFTGQDWVQFSGAGAYTAGDGLGQNGTEFFVKVPADGAGGLVITSDEVQIASTLAGDGLTYGSGILAVGGTTDRITVSSDAVDIASTYAGQTSIVTVGTLTTGALGTGFTTVNVAQGGTGVTTFTTNGIVYGNGANALQVTAAGTWDSGTGTGQLLSVNSSGVPTWTNVIDGGTY